MREENGNHFQVGMLTSNKTSTCEHARALGDSYIYNYIYLSIYVYIYVWQQYVLKLEAAIGL